jgi:hypothetical protein
MPLGAIPRLRHRSSRDVLVAGEKTAMLVALAAFLSRQRRGLPFPGKYYTSPGRNYFRLGAAFYWAGHPEEALIYLD